MQFKAKKTFNPAFRWLTLGAFAGTLPLSIALSATAQLSDISGHWAEECMSQLSQQGILSRYPDGTFRPEATLTRAEYAAMLNTATTGEEAFPDYGKGKLAAAIEQGILIESPNKDFRGAATRLRSAHRQSRSQVTAALCQIQNLSGVPKQSVVKPEGAITLGQTCTNESIGYTVSYPNGWQTSSGNVVNQCQIFDAKAVELEEATKDFNEAIYFNLENIPFAELTSKGSQTAGQLSRRQTTVNGRQAVIEEVESTGIGLLPKGRRFYSYLIDFNDQTLVVRTYDVPSQPYQHNKQILDQMIDRLKFNQAAAN